MSPADPMDDVVTLFLIVAVPIVILWIALPFAVFGIKRRLDLIIEQLAELLKEARKP